MLTKATKWAAALDVPKADVIWMGDNNGSEAADVGTSLGFLRARAVSAWKNAITRTYQGFGKRRATDPGGQVDYILVHGSKRGTVQRYRVVSTPKASDHNLVVMQIKE